MKVSVLAVFGTRPEVIKMAPVIKLLAAQDNVTLKICVTAQHRQMLDQLLTSFDINPDYDLDIMTKNQGLNPMLSDILHAIDPILVTVKPDWVLVQGDTTTSFAASLAASMHKIKVAHIEAGLRTGDIYSPWPEEINRRLTAVMSSLHFAPTAKARSSLLQESIAEDIIHVTGNTIVDALLMVCAQFQQQSATTLAIVEKFSFLDKSRRLILVTGHRRESFGTEFENICHALKLIAARDDVQIVYPVHLNPNVQQPVRAWLSDMENVFLLEPQDYLAFVYLMQNCYLILTDSGGIQEEAPTLGKPVLVMRQVTERLEAIESGAALLVGTDYRRIVNETNRLLDDQDAYQQMVSADNPYGDGRAAERIVDVLAHEA